MTEKELNQIYSGWTAQLNAWTRRELRRHIDCEYDPQTFTFRLYSGHAVIRQVGPGHTVPALVRPPDERHEDFPLPRPETHPGALDLRMTFRQLCLAAARVLEIDLGKRKLKGD